MQWRNPAYNAAGTIDCEINHPAYGWIPFTAVAGDTGAEFDVDALLAEITAAGNIAAYVPPAPTVPASITKVQFVRAARAAGLWDTYKTAIEAHADWPYVTEIPRTDPMVLDMASGLGFTEAQLDALWIAGASL